MKKRERPKLKLVGHYMMIGGEKVEIDPKTTVLADRCKIALAYIATGRKYAL